MNEGCNYCRKGCSADCSYCGLAVCLDCAFVYGVPGYDKKSPPTWFAVCVGCSVQQMAKCGDIPEVHT